MKNEGDKVEIENINILGRAECVDRIEYLAMKRALLFVLPTKSPMLTVAEAKAEFLLLFPQSLFPEGSKVGWWLKAIQLDVGAHCWECLSTHHFNGLPLAAVELRKVLHGFPR